MLKWLKMALTTLVGMLLDGFLICLRASGALLPGLTAGGMTFLPVNRAYDVDGVETLDGSLGVFNGEYSGSASLLSS